MKPGWIRKFLGFDWDALAGVIAAVLALVLHLLNLVETDVLVVLAVFLVALLFIRDMRRERFDERMLETLTSTGIAAKRIESALVPPDTLLIGPARIREESARFSHEALGDMVWFHVCLLMFKPQWLFDVLLKPAIENPRVKSVTFVLDPQQKALWQDHVLPKIQCCKGSEKVLPPHWVPIQENVSIIVGENRTGQTECLLSFWGEPFMSHHAGRDVPRFVFWVQGHSELVPHLVEIIRRHRLA
jgi:hypothetical protein